MSEHNTSIFSRSLSAETIFKKGFDMVSINESISGLAYRRAASIAFDESQPQYPFVAPGIVLIPKDSVSYPFNVIRKQIMSDLAKTLVQYDPLETLEQDCTLTKASFGYEEPWLSKTRDRSIVKFSVLIAQDDFSEDEGSRMEIAKLEYSGANRTGNRQLLMSEQPEKIAKVIVHNSSSMLIETAISRVNTDKPFFLFTGSIGGTSK